jgi:hypothetical protein
MALGWLRRKVRSAKRLKRRTSPHARHYNEHKERARALVHERLVYWNQFYNFEYKRVAIRNQRSRWGSCSTKQNLNFNFRIVFLPIELVDYIVVHELCHLQHFNHSPDFWATVATQLPDYAVRKQALYEISPHMQTIMTGATLKQSDTIHV